MFDHQAVIAVHRDRIAQAMGNAFEDGAQEVGRLVFRCQADKAPRASGLKWGCPFASQVRQEISPSEPGATEAARESNWRRSGTWQASLGPVDGSASILDRAEGSDGITVAADNVEIAHRRIEDGLF